MSPADEKREAYDAAKRLLDTADDSLLRYAALELRRCIEALVYEKLEVYQKHLPPNAQKWQPDKAWKALLRLDPLAEGTRTISLAPSQGPGGPAAGPFVQLGTDHRLPAKTMQSLFHKLGGFLHAHWPREPRKVPDRRFLQQTLEELRLPAESHFTAAFLFPIAWDCVYCQGKQTVLTTQGGWDESREAFCVSCDGRYEREDAGDRPVPDWGVADCQKCGSEVRLAHYLLRDGAAFRCGECGSGHTIHQAWQYTLSSPGS